MTFQPAKTKSKVKKKSVENETEKWKWERQVNRAERNQWLKFKSPCRFNLIKSTWVTTFSKHKWVSLSKKRLPAKLPNVSLHKYLSAY